MWGRKLLEIWQKWLGEERATDWLEQRFANHPEDIPQFLAVLWDWNWDRERDPERRFSRRRQHFDAPETGHAAYLEFFERIDGFIPTNGLTAIIKQHPYFGSEAWRSAKRHLRFVVECFMTADEQATAGSPDRVAHDEDSASPPIATD